jgi:4-amino-4-deoxy-L-arabinose transferase-like glycosyltransferase
MDFQLSARRSVERLAERLQRHNTLLLIAFAVTFLLITGRIAAHKNFWYDELYTLYVSRAADPAEMWGYLRAGVDLNPPLSHILTAASIRAFGESPLSVRLPSMLGLLVALLCVHWFVARRSSPLYAWLAVLFLLSSRSLDYAFEARPYALVLGFCGLSLVCWQAVEEGRRRKLALAGLALSLAAAVSCHYYAVLLFIPLGLGELVRSYDRRRIDPGVWAAFGVGLLPLAAFLPLIAAARSFSAHFWAKPMWMDVKTTYEKFLYELSMPFMIGLALLFTYPRWAGVFSRDPQDGTRQPSRPEVAVVLGLIALPLFGVALGKYATGVFTQRYILAMLIGVGMLLAFVLHRHAGRTLLPALLVGTVLGGWGLLRSELKYRQYEDRAVMLLKTADLIDAKGDPDVPLVVADPQLFLEMNHYATANGRRVVYLSSLEAPLRQNLGDTDERALRALSQAVPLRLEELEGFLAANPRFEVLAFRPDWLQGELDRRGAKLALQGRERDTRLYAVENPVQAAGVSHARR